MLQLNHVLCLVSLPVASSAALQQAAHLVGTHAGDHEVGLHVVSGEATDPSGFVEEVEKQIGPLRETTFLETHVRSASGSGGGADRVKRYASEHDIDLLVLDPPVDRGVLPSLKEEWAKALADQLGCPLFFANETQAPSSIERILVPTDLSDESIHTLRHAAELADGYDAEVLLLHVIDRSPYVALTTVDRLSLGQTTLTEHRARRRLQQFLEERRPPDVPIHARLAFGEPADRIAHVVTEGAVDLLMLASHGAGNAPESSLGPVADRVLRRVTCPTVLIRAGDRSLLPVRSNSGSQERGR